MTNVIAFKICVPRNISLGPDIFNGMPGRFLVSSQSLILLLRFSLLVQVKGPFVSY